MPVEEIVVLAKTYPELSTKHGPLVCVAGVNKYKEWRRLYPIPYKIWTDERYENLRFKKWDVIRVEVSEEPPQHDRRPESRRVISWENIKVIDHINKWEVRLAIVTELLDRDIESIISSKRSLGVIKPYIVYDFFSKPRERLKDEAEKDVLKKIDEADSTITLAEYIRIKDKNILPDATQHDVKIEELPWIGYKFKCNPQCKGHEMMAIDWEAQELFRKYRTVEGPVREKLLHELVFKREIYFVVGNTWKFHKSFMIIGLFYPPRGTKPLKPLKPLFEEKPKQRTLLDIISD